MIDLASGEITTSLLARDHTLYTFPAHARLL
jgi:hypothetical protein